jgi:hypothetical protein
MLVYILSQPRSGSTVLTAILDKRKGVVCLPESSFPQVLGVIGEKERANPKWLAALYLGSTFPPTPLTMADAEACMFGSNEEILFSLGKALAAKIGRDPAEVETVVWKTTRTIGMHNGPLSTNGKFIVLRRHPHNVFESQFRFEYGVRNRNPYRYGIFAQSYEHALSRCPRERTLELDYAEIPDKLVEITKFLNVEDRGEWETGKSSLELVAESCSWLTQITEKFSNTDEKKRAQLSPTLARAVTRSLYLTRCIRPFIGPLRAFFDRRSMEDIHHSARSHFKETH